MKNNNKYLKNIIIVALLVFFALSCKKETEYDLITGQLISYVYLDDTNDHSGINVKVEGSRSNITVTTNSEGKYIIDDLECGTYNIIYSKEGYCDYKITGQQFIGGSKPYILHRKYLYRKPTTQIENLEVSPYSTFFNIDLLLKAAFVGETDDYFFIRGYFSNSSDVSYKNYEYTERFYSSRRDTFRTNYEVDTLLFPTGSQLYVILYPSTYIDQYYIDINTGREIFTSIDMDKPTNVASIIVPEVDDQW